MIETNPDGTYRAAGFMSARRTYGAFCFAAGWAGSLSVYSLATGHLLAGVGCAVVSGLCWIGIWRFRGRLSWAALRTAAEVASEARGWRERAESLGRE